MNSVLLFRFSTSSKISLITLGMIPNSSSLNPLVYPEPMVHVFPDPVCPYASTVALYPRKHPRTKFLTHLLNTSSWRLSWLKQASKVNCFSAPMATVLLASNARTICFSKSSFLMSGLTLSATLTEHAAWFVVSAKKPSRFGCASWLLSSPWFSISASSSGAAHDGCPASWSIYIESTSILSIWIFSYYYPYFLEFNLLLEPTRSFTE